MNWDMKEGVLQVHATKIGVLLDPVPNLLNTLHAKLVFLDCLVEPLKVQDWPKLARTTGLGHSKVGRYKLALDRVTGAIDSLVRRSAASCLNTSKAGPETSGYIGQDL